MIRCPSLLFDSNFDTHITTDKGGIILMQEVYFRNVNVVDVKKKRIIQRQDVTMKNGKITSLIPHTEKKISGAIDCTGKYLCPGLMDMHVHLVWDGTLADPVTANIAEGPYVAMLRALHAAQEYLCRGITVVRDVGCNEDVTIYLAAAMRKKLVWGCQIIPCGSAITGTYGHVPSIGRIADTNDELIRAVRTIKNIQNHAGVSCQWVKIMATGGAAGPEEVGPAMYSEENLRIIMAEASRLHMKVAAHALSREGISSCIDASIHTIEHGADIPVEKIAAMKAKGITLVPTLWVYKVLAESKGIVDEYMSRKASDIVQQQKVTFRHALKSGIRIALGTDAGSPNFGPHPSVFGEMYVMNEYGMDAAEVVRAATIVPAEVLGIDACKGSIEEGKDGDVLLLSGNPLCDLHIFETRLEAVYQQGRLVPPAF